MTLDPNWFYSSLAQSAAAIVGIVGSVLVVRLQSQLEIARRNKEQFLRSFVESRGRWLTQISSMNSLTQYIERTQPLVASALEKGATRLNVTEQMNFRGSRSGSAWEMPINPADLKVLDQNAKGAALLREILSELVRVQDLRSLANQFSLFEKTKRNLPEESHHIVDSVLSDLRRLIEPITRHAVQTSIWTSVTLTVVLAWLCLFGLLVPLTYLSAYADAHKYWLTGAFSVAVLALPVVLALQIKEVKTTALLKVAPEDILP